jgi:hypothetical protein
MHEPPVDATTPSFLPDGQLPRLGGSAPAATAATPPPPAHEAPLAAPAIPTTGPTTGRTLRPPAPSPMLNAPGSAPVLCAPELPSLPTVPTTMHQPVPTPVAPAPIVSATAADLPTLPAVSAAAHRAAADTDETAEPMPATTTGEHPMAHLMPEKSAPSEASRRAAEARAAKKAKARKIKIGVALGTIAVSAIVGPPLGKWFVSAINEAGSTSTEIEG